MHVDGGGEIFWIESHRKGYFQLCPHLLRAEFGEALETISGENPFGHCSSLTRIAIPLNANLFDGIFDQCRDLARVDLVGSIHDIVSSFHLKTWISR